MLNFPKQEKRMSLHIQIPSFILQWKFTFFPINIIFIKKKSRPENFVAILTAILVHFFCLLNHSWYKEMGLVCCLFGYINKNISAYTQNTC